jgi:methyl-accepting chemotaxis protein
MSLLNNIALKHKFGGFVVIVAFLAVLGGFLLVNGIHAIQLLTHATATSNINSLYAKELQVTLLKINSSFKNVADLDEGLDDAESNMDVVRQTLKFLIDNSPQGESNFSRNRLEQYAAHFDTFYNAGRQAATAFMQAGSGDTEDYFNKIDDLATPLITETESLISKYFIISRQDTLRTRKDLLNVRIGGLAVLGLLMGLIVAMSVLLYRNILTPVSEFKKTIAAMTKDGWNLTYTFNERRKDEFGELARFSIHSC